MIKRTFIISFVLSLALFAWLFVLLVNIVGRGTNTSDHWIPKSIQYKRALAEAICFLDAMRRGLFEMLFQGIGERRSDCAAGRELAT